MKETRRQSELRRLRFSMGQALESQGKVEKSLGGCASIAMTSAMLGQPRVRVNNLIASEVENKVPIIGERKQRPATRPLRGN
jgi:hypothetical protein